MVVRVAVNQRFEILIDGSLIWLALSLVVAGGFVGWGQVKLMHPAISLNFAAMVTAIAAVTGGLGSFLLPWLVLVPVGAAHCARARDIAFASILAFACLGGLYLGEIWSLLPQPNPSDLAPTLRAAGVATALLYAGAIGAGLNFSRAAAGGNLPDGHDINRIIVEKSKDAYSIHNRAGSAKLVWAGASGIFGVSPSSLHGVALVSAIHHLDREAFVDACARAVDHGQGSEMEMRVWRRRGDLGEFIWVRGHFYPLGPASGSAASCLVVVRDIGTHKHMENLLRDAHDAALRADQAKSRLLANVTHELRTPLNAIIGFSDILDGELKKEDFDCEHKALSSYVDLISESGTHLLQVVNDLLEMSAIEAGEAAPSMEDFDLGDLLRATARMVEPFAKSSGVRLKFDFSGSVGSVVADKRAIRQIVINLLSNAVKFSNEASTVTIGAGVGANAATLWVEDEGIGISKCDQKKLCQPFFQADVDADRNFEGTGLGLSVVKKLVERHDGSMQIESEPGKGTTVRIKIPRWSNLNGAAIQANMPANGVT